MKNISQVRQCANCGACYNVCPADAIRVDARGLFYRVEVDPQTCIGCGKCLQVCPVNRQEPRQELRSAWYGVHTDSRMVRRSSSGGAFTALAQWILARDGVVYGACYTEDRKQVVFRGTDRVDLEQLRRSKYVESQVGMVFREVKQQLETGRMVLLCGTPCQVAGLLRFLGREYPNLYTCDFSCGGVPSHGIYQQYLQMLEGRYRSPVTEVNFRPKTLGWEDYAIRVDFADGGRYECPGVLDPYFRAFLNKHCSVRDCCLECRFADNHYGDLVLADFWKYREFTGKRNRKGVSLILVNSRKGQQLLEAAAPQLDCRELDLEKASYNIKRKEYSRSVLDRRQQFLQCVQSEGLAEARKYLDMPAGRNAMQIRLKSALKRILWGAK